MAPSGSFATVNRRQFLSAAAAVLVAACGDDGSGSTTDAESSSEESSTTSTSTSTSTTGSESSTTGADTGSSETGTTGPPPVCAEDVEGDVGFNHDMGPHSLTVPLADIEVGREVIYDLLGQADHMHALTVTAEDFEVLEMGGSVEIQSSIEVAHSHFVMLSCV